MRISLVAALFVSLVGCVGVIDSSDPGPGPGPGPGGDDTTPPGDDDQPPPPTPKLDSSVDKMTIDNTELGTSHEIKLSLVGSGTFAGAVMVTPSLVDATMAPITDWTITLDNGMVTLPTNGTATVTATLKIPSNATTLAGNVKFAVSSSVGNAELVSAVTALNQVTLVITQNGAGQCVYPTEKITNMAAGSKIRFLNMGPDNIIIHGNGDIPHQNINGGGIGTNAAYEVNVGAGSNGSWYCHAPGPDTGNQNQVRSN